MKKGIKFSILGIALGAVIFITTASSAATTALVRVYADYSAVKKIVVDGIEKKPSDNLQPFVVKGKPYVPLQFIEDALGKDVDYDAKTGTITIESLPRTLNVWSFTDELPRIVQNYMELHPDFEYEINETIIATTDGAYQPALDLALAGGGPDIPDIYGVESAFVQKYTQGSAAKFAAAYKDLGIDVDKLVKEAEIAKYTIDIGTRTSDRQLVGLTYQATGGACIYRRSIARDVWGTDDPKVVKDKIGPGWNQFFKAAEQLKAKGYGIVSSDSEVWRVVEGSSPTGWVVNGRLNIDPAREKFLDYAKQIKDKGWSNDTVDWTDSWFADMMDKNEKKVFCYFGPAWLINYVIEPNSNYVFREAAGTYGDWAVCEPPAGFFWGGTWILSHKDARHKEAVGDILEWITLDTSKTGLQYMLANGLPYGYYNGAPQETVPSGAVMKKSDGKLDFLDGQNMFDVYVRANELATGKNKTEYDEVINHYWRNAVRKYANGRLTRSEAIKEFKKNVADDLGIK